MTPRTRIRAEIRVVTPSQQIPAESPAPIWPHLVIWGAVLVSCLLAWWIAGWLLALPLPWGHH